MSFNLFPTSPSSTEKSSISSIKQVSPSWTLLSPGLEHELKGSVLSASSEAAAEATWMMWGSNHSCVRTAEWLSSAEDVPDASAKVTWENSSCRVCARISSFSTASVLATCSILISSTELSPLW
uniref:Uncharacterized protein n=1 Tax=Arundo donax TaxID=35708 RepID=A0A0A9D6L9_ARUDO